ncbi:MAG: Gfo/Idh/MocA family oxidoreductase [Burkholderiales bacterium]|nr:Gfo/Idh/MocA family oxidoreductase [Phycisphaerae bacterium]
MAKTWRCAVVGTGVVGEWHVKLLPTFPNAKLVAVCDVDGAKAAEKLKKNNITGVAVYTSEAEMLAKEQIDIVHVCTPSGDHLAPAIMAMEAGKNVITEKPMEIKLDRIEKMHAVAKEKGVRIAGIFQNRWNESNRTIKKAVEEGRFGTLSFGACYTPWYRTDGYYRDGGWRGTWAMDGGGAIMNQSVHAIDLLQWIMGPIKVVSAHASSRIHPEIEVEDTLACSLTFANGAHGVIMGTTAMYPGGGVRIEVGGADGTAISEGGLKRFAFRDKRPEDQELLEKLNTKKSTTAGGSSATDVELDLHYRNISAILDSWDRGEDAETHPMESRKAVAIILAMYESAKKGGVPVEVK